ncbi:MAG TPA: hypothetical protein VEK38_00125 [Candidatus Bathyarchaeia archaeon]|nr:hypothetical protein [Candidatus Bathyarchaeia archaeon]
MKYSSTHFSLIFISALALILPSCIQRKKQNLPRHYTTHQKAAHAYEKMVKNHYTILTIAQTEHDSSHFELKKEILLRNDLYNKEQEKRFMANNAYKDLPLLQYKNSIDKDIAQLNRYLKKIIKKTTKNVGNLEKNMQKLVAQLEQVNTIIIVMPEYHQEKIKAADLQNGFAMKFLTSGIFAGLKKLIAL